MNDSRTEIEQLIGRAFAATAFELYLVGGAIRDEFLGRTVQELDFATDAMPEDSINILQMIAGASVYRAGQKFGTVGAVLGDCQVEITTYRSEERYDPGSRKPTVEFGKSLADDLSRRDFTINAMARRAATDSQQAMTGAGAHVIVDSNTDGALIDPFRGRDDLNARLLRTVGIANDRFREDPLRLLRGVRFAASLGLEIEADTLAAMKESGTFLTRISRERVADELNRMLTGPAPVLALTLMRDTGLLGAAVPELLALASMDDHGPRHQLSLWEHTMRVVAGVPADPMTRWAALLHDIAKPQTRSFDQNGRIRFPQHDAKGANEAIQILNSLRMSNDMVASVSDLVETHMQFHQYSAEWSDGAVRRLCIRLGPNFHRAIDLARADAKGHGVTSWGVSMVEALDARARQLSQSLTQVKSPLDGRELSEHYHRAPGPWIGRIKDTLTDMVMEGALKPEDKSTAWTIADRVAEESQQ